MLFNRHLSHVVLPCLSSTLSLRLDLVKPKTRKAIRTHHSCKTTFSCIALPVKSGARCCICWELYILHTHFQNHRPKMCPKHHLCSLFVCLNTGTCIHQCTLTVRSFDRSLAPVQTSSQASQDLAGLHTFATTGEDHIRR